MVHASPEEERHTCVCRRASAVPWRASGRKARACGASPYEIRGAPASVWARSGATASTVDGRPTGKATTPRHLQNLRLGGHTHTLNMSAPRQRLYLRRASTDKTERSALRKKAVRLRIFQNVDRTTTKSTHTNNFLWTHTHCPQKPPTRCLSLWHHRDSSPIRRTVVADCGVPNAKVIVFHVVRVCTSFELRNPLLEERGVLGARPLRRGVELHIGTFIIIGRHRFRMSRYGWFSGDASFCRLSRLLSVTNEADRERETIESWMSPGVYHAVSTLPASLPP